MERINRILQVDVDTDRDNMIQVKCLATYPNRPDLDSELNFKADIIVLTQGLLAAILHAEDRGVYKKGEAMGTVIDNLNNGYIDSENQLNIFDPNKE